MNKQDPFDRKRIYEANQRHGTRQILVTIGPHGDDWAAWAADNEEDLGARDLAWQIRSTDKNGEDQGQDMNEPQPPEVTPQDLQKLRTTLEISLQELMSEPGAHNAFLALADQFNDMISHKEMYTDPELGYFIMMRGACRELAMACGFWKAGS